MLRSISGAAVVIAAMQSSVLASCLDDAAKFAREICGDIAKEGANTSAAVKGSLEAKANGVLARTVGSGTGAISGEAARAAYSGVVREQLAGDRFDSRDCRQKMVEVAVKQLCKESEKPAPLLSSGDNFQKLLGRWVKEGNGETIQIRSDGDIFGSSQGQGRISSTTEAGANFVVNYPAFSCFYYVNFTTSGAVIFSLRKGGKSCLPGTFLKVAD